MFTYPFCYTPADDIVKASKRIIDIIDNTPVLREAFCEGKMLGVLKVLKEDGSVDYLYGFSGLAGGQSHIEGFVPPIFDLYAPGGHYRTAEAAISAETDPEIKKAESRKLQDWIFRQYVVLNAEGNSSTILQIFADRGLVPPGGTGDCAAPKMLQYAYSHRMKPLAMGEFWYGASSQKEVRIQGCFYPSCAGKCGPLLDYMLQGLDVEPNPLKAKTNDPYKVIYEDGALIVVDKPSGMLCVPGKTGEKSLLELLQKSLGCRLFPCHRLDMDTSGILVYAKTQEAQSDISQQFERRETRKEYVARLSSAGVRELSEGESGRIVLPMMPDYYDRPRQMVDFNDGKEAVTDYIVTGIGRSGGIDVVLKPKTGRTHQLRVHCAHPMGLGHPICGDRLYGGNSNGDTRLYLHARYLSFRHPVTGVIISFESEVPF